jgi:hypothetical protein
MEIPSKDKMLDTMGRPITQSLFLEIGYTDAAVYTLKENDFEYNGKLLPSIRKLYLDIGDPTEYEFATTCFIGWSHWQRISENKVLRRHIEEWRVELEVKLRSRGVKAAMLAANTGNYQAAKWLADRGWDTRGAGRPSKADVEKETKIQAAISEEYSADILRLQIK